MPPKMPSKRKEPKETVVYPSSKRPTPAFKPLRPSKIQRTASESSVKSKAAAKKTNGNAAKTAEASKPATVLDQDDDDLGGGIGDSEDDSEETLEDDPLAATSRPQKKATKPTTARRRESSTRDPSRMSISSSHHNDDPDPPGTAADPIPSQSDDIPSIPQPLLLRLLHESFADKNTKIDTQAVQVLQKYVEIFVQEAIARTKFQKDEEAAAAAAEDGVGGMETATGWLELEDLEKAAPALVLDF